MANLSNQDSGATEPVDARLPDPNPHGQVHVGASHPNRDTVVKQMTAHLKEHVASTNATADYGGHGTAASQGAFSPGGASGADYETSSQDTVGDADSGGASGY
jgi:hypothetical protein